MGNARVGEPVRKDRPESSTYDRPRLLPRLGALGVMSLLASAMAYSPIAVFGIVLVSTGYLGVVILKTRDLVSNAARLHPSDRWICRKSGMLAAALAAALIMGLSVLVAKDMEPAEIGLGSWWGLLLLGFVMEIGVVLCVACLWAPRNLRHIRPLVLWKVMAIPLLLIYGAYVVLLLITPIATMMTAQE